MDAAGLYGLTFGDNYAEAYDVGDTQDTAGLEQFEQSILKADDALGDRVGEVARQVARLWPYGRGEAGPKLRDIHGPVPTREAGLAGAKRTINGSLTRTGDTQTPRFSLPDSTTDDSKAWFERSEIVGPDGEPLALHPCAM